jgi:hypothetical protein
MNMKFPLLFISLATLCLGGQAFADPNVETISEMPLLGTWALDVEQMQIPAELRPKNVSVTFADAGAGKWETRIDIIGADDSQRHMISTYERDGLAVAIEGDQLEADAVAVSTPTPKTLIMALAKSGRPASTRVYSVVDEGNTMIEKAVSYNDAGMPVIRTNRFLRIIK